MSFGKTDVSEKPNTYIFKVIHCYLHIIHIITSHYPLFPLQKEAESSCYTLSSKLHGVTFQKMILIRNAVTEN